MKRANGNELDRLICEEVKRIAVDESVFIKQLKQGLRKTNYNNDSYQENLKELRKSKAKYEKEIRNLVDSLAKDENSAASTYILKQINEIDNRIKAIDTQINEYLELANSTTSSEQDFEILVEMLSNTANYIDEMTVEQKRNALRSVIHKIVWDGENAHIYYFGDNDSEIDLTDDDNFRAVASGLQTKF